MEKCTGEKKRVPVILAVSGGADSLYLLDLYRRKPGEFVVGHYNLGARGKESEADERFLEKLCREWGVPLEVGRELPQGKTPPRTKGKGKAPPRFEEKARKKRYDFLRDLMRRTGAGKILVAHTADDQVETVLMRVLEGAGITGLKGIPRSTEDGIERPLLDAWREEILNHLERNRIEYRIDRSNFDTHFERNWIRHVLIPLLEKRYGKSVKKRIFALGERFREIDEFLEEEARKWMRRHLPVEPGRTNVHEAEKGEERVILPRKPYRNLPSALRKKILQLFSYERVGTVPNERLLEAMDRLVVSGRPSARLRIGRGASLGCRYEDAVFLIPTPAGKPGISVAARKEGKREERPRKKSARDPILVMNGPGRYDTRGGKQAEVGTGEDSHLVIHWVKDGNISPDRLRRIAEGERGAAFDSDLVSASLPLRALRMGDRIRPFGLDAEKKVKEILIDRKVPREERWGRPVVCDSEGNILWIPGLVRSSHAPVTPRTKRTVVLRAERSRKGAS